MAIIQTVNQTDFICAFHEAGRGSQFTPDALRMIFDYLEEYSDSTGETVELDVVAICCDYSQMTYDEIIEAYNIEVAEDSDKQTTVLDHLEYHSVVIGHNDDFVVFADF